MAALDPYFEAGERVCIVADHAPVGATPRFPQAAAGRGLVATAANAKALGRHWIIRMDKGGTLADFPPDVRAFRCPVGAPPPAGDIAPETPVFDQIWHLPFPAGFGFTEALAYPGGTGANVTIVDIEYAWNPGHEDLENIQITPVSGVPEPEYAYHGNGVLGILAATENAYGVVGGATSATVLVAHPDFIEDEIVVYDVARSILDALSVLVAGDVILIEQQVYGPELEYLPVTWDPAVRDVIEVAATAGVTVIVAAGNGLVDLDDPVYEGAFSSGSGILVGAGQPSDSIEPRSLDGSNFGLGVAVQGWGSGIVTAGGEVYHDLYFPDDDVNQAYTAHFGGSSGASALVAAMVAVLQSVAIETRGTPLTPVEIKALLVRSGDAEAGDYGIGPQPNLLRALRTWFVP